MIQPYVPNALPISDLDLRRLLPLVGRANAALARYDGLLQSIPDPDVMLSPLTTREAVLSSKIEGTQATLDQVLEQEAGIKHTGELDKDIIEISNYRTALVLAADDVRDSPIRLHHIRQMHSILMDGVRGRLKSPGEFRKEQNWIGRPGTKIEQATFIPPSPLQLRDHLEAWERYVEEDDLDVLIQCGVMHAQFELLHPFKDGNGRIGRLLIPLFLFQKRALTRPMFYLSEYLEAHRADYYQRLQAISAEGDWDSWIAFFLTAIATQAESNGRRALAIRTLYDTMKQRIQEITRSQYAIYVLDALFAKPIFSASELAKRIGDQYDVNDKTIATMIRQLRDDGILTEIRPAAGRRPAVLMFTELLATAESEV